MINGFIVATTLEGAKILIQVKSIFSIKAQGDGCLIQSIGAGENHVALKESLADIIEKIDGKK